MRSLATSRYLMLLLLPNAASAYQLPSRGAAAPRRSALASCVIAPENPPTTTEYPPMAPFEPAKRLAGSGKPTVWGEFGQLAASTGAVNLGQGFPDWQPPEFVVEEAQTALRTGYHQYTRPAGHPQLVEVLAQRYSKHLERPIDATTEVAITVGASQALYLTLQALIDPGDEVVLMEPAFDLYYGQVRIAGGTVVPVPLEVDESGRQWTLNANRLEAAVNEKTKVLVVNSPHNPTGKVFSADEMAQIADVVRRHPKMLVISDEVYKYTVYGDDANHQHFAALPGMYERTVTLSSAGKTFSVTGWQAGWCIGPATLLKPIQLMLPFVQFCVSTPMQQALSRVLVKADEPYLGHPSYYAWLCEMYRTKREILATGLRRCGMVPMEGQGGFFLMADTSSLEVPEKYLRETTPAAPDGVTRDWALCRWMALEGGVIAIPSSPFFSADNKELAGRYVRFAFCKGDGTLQEASDRLACLSGCDVEALKNAPVMGS